MMCTQAFLGELDGFIHIFLGIRERATPVFRLGEHVVIGGLLGGVRSGQNAKCIVRRDAFGRHRMGPFCVSEYVPTNQVPLRPRGCLDRYFLGSARVVSRRSLRRVSGVRERLERVRTTWLHTVPGGLLPHRRDLLTFAVSRFGISTCGFNERKSSQQGRANLWCLGLQYCPSFLYYGKCRR